MLVPKLFTSLKGYNKDQFFKDAIAGIIVGIVAVPLAIAFAISSGVSPEKGLYTAVIAGFIISFLGGSRVQIGGPTGAFVVVIYTIISKYGYDGLIIATFMAGVILIIMGIAKFGGLIKYIPYPIVTGFTGGIAVIIFTSQIKDFFGLNIPKLPAEFIPKIIMYSQNFASMNMHALGIGVLSLLIIFLWPKINKVVPGSLIAIVISTVIVRYFNLNVETIHSRFGDIPSYFVAPTFHFVSLDTFMNLIGPATTIALLAGIESLLSAVVADGMIGSKHRSNMELVAQGIANIFSSIFGGIPATGAIARTATNIKNGGRTPIAGIIHSLVLLVIMLAFGKWAGMIPLPVLAAILIYVAYNMSEYDAFRAILRGPRSDIIVLLTTFLLTVIVDLTVAIEIGMILASFLFLKKMADTSLIKNVIHADMEDTEDAHDPNAFFYRDIPKEVEVYEISGPFFFASVDKFQNTLKFDKEQPQIIILRMRNVPYMDAGGLHALEEMMIKCNRKKIRLYISDIHTQPLFVSTQSGFLDKLGEHNFFGNLDEALKKSREVLGLPPKEYKPFEPTVEREKQKSSS
jgi:SulP family sulfate permease